MSGIYFDGSAEQVVTNVSFSDLSQPRIDEVYLLVCDKEGWLHRLRERFGKGACDWRMV